MKRTDREYLQDAVQHLEVLHEHLSRPDVDDQLVLDAAALRLSAAIDSVSHVPESIRRRVIDDNEWRAINGMRNRIAHAYGFMDAAVLRSTFDRDVAQFEQNIRRLIAGLDE